MFLEDIEERIANAGGFVTEVAILQASRVASTVVWVQLLVDMKNSTVMGGSKKRSKDGAGIVLVVQCLVRLNGSFVSLGS